MNLEAKPVIFEDLARQILANGFRKQPSVYMRKIGEYQSKKNLRLRSQDQVRRKMSIFYVACAMEIIEALAQSKNEREPLDANYVGPKKHLMNSRFVIEQGFSVEPMSHCNRIQQ